LYFSQEEKCLIPSDPGQIGDTAASAAIDDWLKEDCPPPVN